MNAFNLTQTVTVLANAISCGLSQNEISLLSCIFAQIGDTLATIAAQKSLLESADNDKKE